MDHVALDRAGTNDRDLHHEVVKDLGPQARQHRHLRPALDLEDADGISSTEHRIGLRTIARHAREVEIAAVMVCGEGQSPAAGRKACRAREYRP